MIHRMWRRSKQKTETPKESWSARAIRSAREALDTHHRDRGLGQDEYSAAMQVHPMAEGRLLSSVAVLQEAGVLPSEVAAEFARSSVERLAEVGLPRTGYEIGWGLGFEWRGLPASEPFVITTCIVADGLQAAARVCEDPLARELADKAVAWLRRIPEEHLIEDSSGLWLPAFSPGIRSCPWNVVSEWTAFLSEDDPRRDAVRARVARERVDRLGWCYDKDIGRLDLLHQGYTIDGLRDWLDEETLEKWIIESVAAFATPAGFIDKIDVIDEEQAMSLRGRAGILVHPLNAEQVIAVHAAPARDWSIGEALRLVSRRSGDETRDTALRRMAGQLVEEAVSRLEETGGTRHPRAAMHLVLGLADFIASRRQSSGGT
jgi:hypothetical protein